MTRRPYPWAVCWVALNDNPGSAERDPAVIAGWVSVALVADLYGREPLAVARDVVKARQGREPCDRAPLTD